MKKLPRNPVLLTLALLVLLAAALPLLTGCGGEKGSGSDIDALIVKLASDDEAQRQAASDELVKTGEPAVGPLIDSLYGDTQTMEFLGAVKDTLTAIGEPAVQPLVDSLSYSGERSSTALALKRQILAEIGQPTVQPLTQALSDESARARGAAATTLAAMKETSATLSITELLSDPDAGVRKTAAEALGTMGDAAAIPSLTEALDDEKKEVRKAVRAALASIHQAVGDDPRLQTAYDTCIAVEVSPITDPYGLVIDSHGVMANPEVLMPLTDDEKVYLLNILGECILINK
jgi:HEAT repeat protein